MKLQLAHTQKKIIHIHAEITKVNTESSICVQLGTSFPGVPLMYNSTVQMFIHKTILVNRSRFCHHLVNSCNKQTNKQTVVCV